MPTIVKRGSTTPVSLPQPEVDPLLKDLTGPTRGKAQLIRKQSDFDKNTDALIEAGLIEPEGVDKFRYYVGRRIPGILSAIGGFAGGVGAGSGTFGLGSAIGAGAGAGLGSTIGVELQNEFPRVFGQRPDNPITKIATDALVEGALPEGVGNVISKGVKPVLGGILKNIYKTSGNEIIGSGIARVEAEALSRSRLFPESQILDVAAENVRNIRSGTTSIDPRFAQNPIGEKLLRLAETPNKAGSQLYKDITKEALSDVQNVRNFKLATGGDTEIRQLAFNDLLTSNYRGSTKTFNPTQLLDELNGSKGEIYREAMGGSVFSEFNTFLRNAQTIKSSKDSVLQYAKNRMLLLVPSAFLGGQLAGPLGATAAGAAAIVVSDKVLARLMANPEIAKLTTQALKTGIKAPQASLIDKVLINSLRGLEIELMVPGDKNQKAFVDEEGNLVYQRPSER